MYIADLKRRHLLDGYFVCRINGFLNKFLMGIFATHAVHQMREALSL